MGVVRRSAENFVPVGELASKICGFITSSFVLDKAKSRPFWVVYGGFDP